MTDHVMDREDWREVGRIAAAGARRRAPVRTGQLQRSIRAQSHELAAGVQVQTRSSGEDASTYADRVDERTPFLDPDPEDFEAIDGVADRALDRLERAFEEL